MKGKKAIVLSRVSTIKQDLEQQTNELMKEANRDGYDNDSIIVIENKESAICNDEEHLNGINQMKDLINSDSSIKAVYVYEVSRLSRRPVVLYSIRDFLLEHNVQLVILKPYLRLIEVDGSMSQSASIMFSLFSSISESEMMIKKERLIRGKRQKMSQGKYGGGHICFGYKVHPETKQIVIDEHDAAIVRKMYDMYTETSHSVRTMTKELMETGEVQKTEYENALAFVKLILKSEQYTGGTSPKGLVYPPIISKEQYQKSREKSIAAIRAPKEKVKIVALAKKLLHYKGTGRLMTATQRNYSISSIRHRKHWSIATDAVDKVAWHYAKQYYKAHKMGSRKYEVDRLKKESTVLFKKYEQCYNVISKLNDKYDRIEKRILDGKLDEEKGDAMMQEVLRKIEEQQAQARQYEAQRAQKQQDISNVIADKLNIDKSDLDVSDKIRIVRQTIKDMQIESLPQRGQSSIDIIFIDGTSVTVNIAKKNKYLHVYEGELEIAV